MRGPLRSSPVIEWPEPATDALAEDVSVGGFGGRAKFRGAAEVPASGAASVLRLRAAADASRERVFGLLPPRGPFDCVTSIGNGGTGRTSAGRGVQRVLFVGRLDRRSGFHGTVHSGQCWVCAEPGCARTRDRRRNIKAELRT